MGEEREDRRESKKDREGEIRGEARMKDRARDAVIYKRGREREKVENSPWPYVQIYKIHQALPGRRDEEEKKPGGETLSR